MKHIYLILTVLVVGCQTTPEPKEPVTFDTIKPYTPQLPPKVVDTNFHVKVEVYRILTSEYYYVKATNNNWKTTEYMLAADGTRTDKWITNDINDGIRAAKRFETWASFQEWQEGVRAKVKRDTEAMNVR